MAHPDVDSAVVQRRLVMILGLVGDLEAASGDITERLVSDRMYRYAIERMLTQVVDLAAAINAHVCAAVTGRAPEDNRSSFAAVAEIGIIEPALAEQLAPSVGMRNILIHEYAAVDLGMVAQAVPLAVAQYRDYCRQFARWLPQPV